jgi:hypothetical protein
MRWTQMVLLTRAPACGRRSRVVLTPRRRRQVGGVSSADDGDKKARSPGRARRKPLKPLRAGMPGNSGATVVTTLVCFLHFAHEATGALGARHSPRPRLGGNDMHNSGASRRGQADAWPPCSRWRRGRSRRSGSLRRVERSVHILNLSSSAKAGDPVRRGFTAQSQLPLEYWVARSSRAMTAVCGEQSGPCSQAIIKITPVSPDGIFRRLPRPRRQVTKTACEEETPAERRN